MSVVPYNSTNQIVFYDQTEGILVVHDNQENTIQLFSANNADEEPSSNRSRQSSSSQPHERFTLQCPNCGYDWTSSYNASSFNQGYANPPPRRNSATSDVTNFINIRSIDPREFNHIFKSLPQSFMNHEYFKLLERLPGSLGAFVPRAATQDHALKDGKETNPDFSGRMSSLDQARALFVNRLDVFNQGYFKRFFKKVPPFELGSGARAIVYKVVHVLNDIALGTYAVKRISVGGNFELLDHVLNEVLILYELSVKGANENNLIRYNHVWIEMGDIDDLLTFIIGGKEGESRQVPYVFILQQYCDGGHLESMIQNNYQKEKALSFKEKILLERQRRKNLRHGTSTSPTTPWLKEIEIFKFFSDVITGVNYLHMHGILHRDLKPSNCLLETKYERPEIGNYPYTFEEYSNIVSLLPKVLVLDFGEGQFISTLNIPEPNEHIKKGLHNYERLGNTGTLEFTAPELWLYADDPVQDQKRRFINSFSYESDTYSLGLILCYLCVGCLPYTNIVTDNPTDPEKVRQEIIEWYGKLDEAKFNGWFFNEVQKVQGCRPNACFVDFAHLIFAMIKGSNGKRVAIEEVLCFLEEMKNNRFIYAADSRYNEEEDKDYIPSEAESDTDAESLALHWEVNQHHIISPQTVYLVSLGSLEWLTPLKLPKFVVMAGLAWNYYNPGRWAWLKVGAVLVLGGITLWAGIF